MIADLVQAPCSAPADAGDADLSSLVTRHSSLATPAQPEVAWTPSDDVRRLHELLPPGEAARVKALAEGIALFLRASDKAEAVRTVSRRLSALGVRGVSAPSLYRKAAAWRRGGICALVDGRAARKAPGIALSGNREFLAHWHDLVCGNRRATRPAWSALVSQLRAGETIPGVGTWRDVWASENGGYQPPEGMPCPYFESSPPRGWSLRHLTRLGPAAFALEAARHGRASATLAHAPAVPLTRVGLACGAVWQLDDMWYEQKVAYEGNRHAQRVVEFALLDALTGHVALRLMKPVRERDDGSRETLRSRWTRYVVAALLCSVGIPPEGPVLVMGEHGTAAADPDLVAALAECTGGRVRFGAGSIMSQPLGAGLWGGRPKGNPRYKGRLEGFHALLKNELGAAPGSIGGGRGAEPEEAYGMDREDERLRRLAAALETSRPGLLSRLRLPYVPYDDFCALVDAAYARIEARTDHELEGWEKCGFVTGEWRPAAGAPWMPVSALDAMESGKARAFRSLIESGDFDYRTRRLSRAEAWAQRRGALVRLDPFVGARVMGDALARECVVGPRRTIDFRDPDTDMRCTVFAGVEGGRPLDPGTRLRVWVNPLDHARALLADADGRWLGVAPVMQAGQLGADAESDENTRRNLGLRQKALAEEDRRLAPVVAARRRRAAEDARVNAMELLGRDPAEDAAAEDAAALAAATGPGPASLRDLFPEPNEPAPEKLEALLV